MNGGKERIIWNNKMRINFKNEKERKRQVDTEKNLNEKMK